MAYDLDSKFGQFCLTFIFAILQAMISLIAHAALKPDRYERVGQKKKLIERIQRGEISGEKVLIGTTRKTKDLE